MEESVSPARTRTETIEEIRRDIDRVDDAIHDLLIQRSRLAERIGAVKRSNGSVSQPAREAAMIRRRCQYHYGSLAPEVVVRIWREMIAGYSRIQGESSVIVWHLPEQIQIRDLARDHCGSATPIRIASTVLQALTAVADHSATFAVFPARDSDEVWWSQLPPEAAGTPKVIARLPFYHTLNSSLDAMVVALGAREPTGDDRTLLRVDQLDWTVPSQSSPEIKCQSTSAQRWCIIDRPSSNRQVGLALIEIAGFVTGSADAYQLWSQRLGVPRSSLTVVGGYASQIAPHRHQSHDP